MKNFAVFGLGRFGTAVARELFEVGHDVLAVDTDRDRAAGRAFYGSTHDSQTLAGWCAQAGEDPDQVIRSLYASPAGWAMLQLQDLLLSFLLWDLTRRE